MKIGITGHQNREGIDWKWVRHQIELYLIGKSQIIGFSSLASGTDQVFAEIVLAKRGALKAIIPLDDYETYFEGESLKNYKELLKQSEAIFLQTNKTEEQAFLDAGKWIARQVDCVIAVWDGEPAEGAGGTGDIVEYSLTLKKSILHINPISRLIRTL